MGGTGGRQFGPREDFDEKSLYLDCSRCSRVHCCPNPCTTAHRQVHETRLRKHATILRREPQRREDGNRLFNCRKAVLSKQWAHLGRGEPGRQDMDMRFLGIVPPLLFMQEQRRWATATAWVSAHEVSAHGTVRCRGSLQAEEGLFIDTERWLAD